MDWRGRRGSGLSARRVNHYLDFEGALAVNQTVVVLRVSTARVLRTLELHSDNASRLAVGTVAHRHTTQRANRRRKEFLVRR